MPSPLHLRRAVAGLDLEILVELLQREAAELRLPRVPRRRLPAPVTGTPTSSACTASSNARWNACQPPGRRRRSSRRRRRRAPRKPVHVSRAFAGTPLVEQLGRSSGRRARGCPTRSPTARSVAPRAPHDSRETRRPSRSRHAALYCSDERRWASTSRTDQPAQRDGCDHTAASSPTKYAIDPRRFGIHEVVRVEAFEVTVIGHRGSPVARVGWPSSTVMVRRADYPGARPAPRSRT